MLPSLNVKQFELEKEEKKRGIRPVPIWQRLLTFHCFSNKNVHKHISLHYNGKYLDLRGAFCLFVAFVYWGCQHVEMSLCFTTHKIHRQEILVPLSSFPVQMAPGILTDSKRQQCVALKLQSKIQLWICLSFFALDINQSWLFIPRHISITAQGDRKQIAFDLLFTSALNYWGTVFHFCRF